MRHALILPLFAALALMATLMCPSSSRGDGGLFGPNTQDRQRWFVSPTAHLSATANQPWPSPSLSSVDRCIVTCPANDSVFTVILREGSTGTPLVFSDVILEFSACPNVVLATPNPPGLYEFSHPFHWVLRTTNALGRSDFPLASGGTCGPAQIKLYVSGVLFTSRPFVAAFDQDGDLAVTEADLALVQAKLGTSDLTADFNCDSTVTPSDYEIATTHLGHVHASVVGVGDSPALGFGIRPLSNPSRGPDEFELRSAERGHAQLSIHDLAGRRLATVLDREIDPGTGRVTWSGADASGRRVAAGLYFYRLVLGAQRAQGTVIITR